MIIKQYLTIMHPRDHRRHIVPTGHHERPEDMMQRMMADMDRQMNQMMAMNGTATQSQTMGHPSFGHATMNHAAVFDDFDRGFGMIGMPEGGSPGSHRHRHVTMTKQMMGPDGRMVSENYYNNEIYGRTADGKKISQKEELYKNDGTGEKKISQEKAIDGVRHKVSKIQKAGGKNFLLKMKFLN